MKDSKNYEWTMKDIAHQYKLENPSWAWKECWSKASTIYNELNKMNNQLWKSNGTYYRMNMPFSFYEYDEGLSSIPELDEI